MDGFDFKCCKVVEIENLVGKRQFAIKAVGPDATYCNGSNNGTKQLQFAEKFASRELADGYIRNKLNDIWHEVEGESN